MSKKGTSKGRELRYWDIGDGVAYFKWSDAVEAHAEREKSKGVDPCPDMDKMRDLVKREGKDVAPD